MHERNLIKKAFWIGVALISVCILFLIFSYLLFVRAPSGNTYPITITIESGQGVGQIAKQLEAAKIVRSASATQHLLISSGIEKRLSAGVYIFNEPLNAFVVVKRIINRDFGYTPVKITIPEGTNSKRLTSIISAKLPEVDVVLFEKLAREKEGYLFPDTYFFAPFATSTEVIERMTTFFKIFTNGIEEKVAASGKTFDEIITVASILEGEVQTEQDRKMVADIIYRRLAMNMPLQVDATLAYERGKTSAELTLKDLRTDSPYNTYTRRGLPPTPISNPGLDSMWAALEPIPNPYLFYLSDKDGITHFSKTHDEHVKLKAKYLR